MDRYFIVSYVASMTTGQTIGQIDMTSANGHFLNRQATTEEIIRNNNNMCWDVVITFMLEVQPEEWKIWKYKKETES